MQAGRLIVIWLLFHEDYVFLLIVKDPFYVWSTGKVQLQMRSSYFIYKNNF